MTPQEEVEYVARLRLERNRAEKAEADLAASQAEVERLTRERDEARITVWNERKNMAEEWCGLVNKAQGERDSAYERGFEDAKKAAVEAVRWCVGGEELCRKDVMVAIRAVKMGEDKP